MTGYDDPPRPLAGVYAVEIDDELVLYEPHVNRAVQLDARAALIWRVLDGTVTVEELVGDLSEVFGVDRATVRTDVDSMLSRLHDLGFLEPSRFGRGDAAEEPAVLADPPSP